MKYTFKTEPRWYQLRDFKRFANAKEIALLYEQRCGKSKVIVDLSAYKYMTNQIDSVLLVADPSNVPDNWARDNEYLPGEFQLHLPSDIPVMKLLWKASDAKKKSFAQKWEALLNFNGLAILCVNGEAVRTDLFRKLIPQFLVRRKKIFAVYDETTLLAKNDSAKLSDLLQKISQRYPNVVCRAILDGTIHGDTPFDLYSQFELLRKSFFGYSSFWTFKHHFAAWTPMSFPVPGKVDENGDQVRKLSEVQAENDEGEKIYLHIDELHDKMEPVSARVRRCDAWEGYKEPIFQTSRFDLSSAQRKAYTQLSEEFAIELEGLGTVTAAHVLTRYLRLQQITSNFWPSQDCAIICPHCGGDGCEKCEGVGAILGKTPMARIGKDNPRLEALKEATIANEGKHIVWARYHQEIDDILELLASMGRKPVRYDGLTNSQDKLANEIAFQKGDATDIVANPAAMARGKKLSAASCHIVYSNYFALLTRLQMQDRAEDFDKKEPTSIIDLIANDSVDEIIVSALRAKRRIGDLVMKEESKKWL